MAKLSKEDLKEDAFITFLYEAQEKIKKHARPIGFSVGTILVLLMGMGYYRWNSDKEIQKALSAYGEALVLYQNGKISEAKVNFIRVNEDYSGTPDAGRACYFLGHMFYETGDYKNAVQWYENYINGYKTKTFMDIAAFKGLAASYENLKDYQKALDYYQDAIDVGNGDFQYPELLWKASLTAKLLGKTETAQGYLKELISDYPDSPEKKNADWLIGEI